MANRCGYQSIADDDICSECKNLPYNVGGESLCTLADPEWPAEFDEDGLAISCEEFDQVDNQGDNWV